MHSNCGRLLLEFFIQASHFQSYIFMHMALVLSHHTCIGPNTVVPMISPEIVRLNTESTTETTHIRVSIRHNSDHLQF